MVWGKGLTFAVSPVNNSSLLFLKGAVGGQITEKCQMYTWDLAGKNHFTVYEARLREENVVCFLLYRI